MPFTCTVGIDDEIRLHNLSDWTFDTIRPDGAYRVEETTLQAPGAGILKVSLPGSYRGGVQTNPNGFACEVVHTIVP
jgi:hypothetical protein